MMCGKSDQHFTHKTVFSYMSYTAMTLHMSLIRDNKNFNLYLLSWQIATSNWFKTSNKSGHGSWGTEWILTISNAHHVYTKTLVTLSQVYCCNDNLINTAQLSLFIDRFVLVHIRYTSAFRYRIVGQNMITLLYDKWIVSYQI